MSENRINFDVSEGLPESYKSFSGLELVKKDDGTSFWNGIVKFGEGDNARERRVKLDVEPDVMYDHEGEKNFYDDYPSQWQKLQNLEQSNANLIETNANLIETNANLEARIAALEERLENQAPPIQAPGPAEAVGATTATQPEVVAATPEGTVPPTGVVANEAVDEPAVDTNQEVEQATRRHRIRLLGALALVGLAGFALGHFAGKDNNNFNKAISQSTTEMTDTAGTQTTDTPGNVTTDATGTETNTETANTADTTDTATTGTETTGTATTETDTEGMTTDQTETTDTSSTETTGTTGDNTTETNTDTTGLIAPTQPAETNTTDETTTDNTDTNQTSPTPGAESTGSGGGFQIKAYNEANGNGAYRVKLPKELEWRKNPGSKPTYSIVAKNGKMIVSRVGWDRQGNLDQDTRTLIIKNSNYKLTQGTIQFKNANSQTANHFMTGLENN